jgi:phosphate uptake regulator
MFEKLFGSSSTLVESAFRDVDRMIADAASMTDIALATILDNQPLEVDLDRIDDRVDEGERMVRRTVLEHLVMNPKDHLVASLVLASVVQDAERLGDVARGLAELDRLAREPRVGPFRDELAVIAGEIRPLFDVCRTAFARNDVEAAQRVVAKHRDLKKRLATIVERVAASEQPAAPAVVYALAATYLRRLGAHLSNIASTVLVPYDRIRHGDEEA